MIISQLYLLASIPCMALQLLFALPAEGWRCLWKRLPLFILLWLAHCILTLLHIAGHLLDELLFFSYRHVKIKGPVFILGLPRSGTTYLQRLISNDDRFTTFTTWEAILAPSITERYLYRGLGLLLAPLGGLAGKTRKHLFKSMDRIHAIRLNEPEEDFLLLIPMQACLLMAFLMPGSTHLWRLGNFDDALPDSFRRRVLNYYQGCLKKHLLFHGTDKRLLSKNPSFTSWIRSLLDRFEDAKIIACTRPPAEVLPSQLSSLRPAMRLLGNSKLAPKSQEHIMNMLHYYYAVIGQLQHAPGVTTLPMTQLQSALGTVLPGLYRFINLDVSASMATLLEKEASRPRSYSSGHKYSLAEFSLTDKAIENRFRDVWPLPNPLSAGKEAGAS